MLQVHYSSFQVSFLDFEEEQDQTSQEGGGDMEDIEDDDGIEGWVEREVCVKTAESALLPPCRFSVENAYLEEKEDVCNSLAEIAENLG